MEEQKNGMQTTVNKPHCITIFQMSNITTLKVWRIKELTYVTEENSRMPRWSKAKDQNNCTRTSCLGS